MANAEGEDKPIKGNAAALVNGVKQFLDAGLAPTLAVLQFLEGALIADARDVPVLGGWEDPPIDVSAKVCPLIDEKHLRQITQEDLSLRIDQGFCLAQDRVLVVAVDPETLECKAHLARMPPNCLP